MQGKEQGHKGEPIARPEVDWATSLEQMRRRHPFGMGEQAQIGRALYTTSGDSVPGNVNLYPAVNVSSVAPATYVSAATVTSSAPIS